MASGSSPSSGRKTSVTSALVHSSIFSGLSILPESEKPPVMAEQEGYPIRTNRRERTSQTRLNFLSKSGAGSVSSGRQASIDSESSPVSLMSPVSGEFHRSLALHSRDSVTSLDIRYVEFLIHTHGRYVFIGC